MISIRYDDDVELPEPVRDRLRSWAREIKQHRPWWRQLFPDKPRISLEQSIARKLLRSGKANRIVLQVLDAGIVKKTDGTEVWNIYYCQLDESHVLAIDGLTFDCEITGGVWPNSEVEIYWHVLPNGAHAPLAVVPRGVALVPVFSFNVGECGWPYLPEPRLIEGHVDRIGEDRGRLHAEAASELAMEQVRRLLRVLC